MNKEAMKLALGKIESARDCHPNAVDTLLFEAEEILEGALAEQPAQQEPVAWMSPHGGFLSANYINNFASGLDKEIHNIPLYTSPPAQRTWVGLTDGELPAMWTDAVRKAALPPNKSALIHYKEAIEAKLRSKNEDRN